MQRRWSVIVVCLLVAGACGEGEGATDAPADTVSVAGETVATTASTTAPSATVPPTTVPPTTVPPATVPPTTVRAVPEVRFDLGSGFLPVEGVAIPHGPDGAWDAQYTDPGAAVFVDGVIHVFQNGFVGWPSEVGVGYWASDDGGVTWNEVSDDPVFDGSDLSYAGVTSLASSVLREDDGTWTLYFYTWDDASWPVSASKIGRATAPEPTGPWTADPQPVLVPGGEGSWDDLAVRTPSVVKTADGYVMWYEGGTKSTAMIGMATSADGITWDKYDDPATTGVPFAESDPVLVPADEAGDGWDKKNVYIPNVVATADGYAMLYSASNSVSIASQARRTLGLAVSADGISWTRSAGPVVSARDFGGSVIYFSELVADDTGLVVLVEVEMGNTTEVHGARFDGVLPTP